MKTNTMAFYLWLWGGTMLYFGELTIENMVLFIYRDAKQAFLQDAEWRKLYPPRPRMVLTFTDPMKRK